MAQRYLHFSAFLPLFFLWREKISCFFLLLLSFKTNLEAYPLLLSCLLDVHLLLFSLQPQIMLRHARFTHLLFDLLAPILTSHNLQREPPSLSRQWRFSFLFSLPSISYHPSYFPLLFSSLLSFSCRFPALFLSFSCLSFGHNLPTSPRNFFQPPNVSSNGSKPEGKSF